MTATAKVTASHYRGRLAPSPTGHVHLGHARTFWIAQGRCMAQHGTLILRNDDLDVFRCREEFVRGMLEDLRWFGLEWQEGPDCGGTLGPYNQSQRSPFHRDAFEKLRSRGMIYPCVCSRKDLHGAATAPHAADEEPIYPGTCRERSFLEKDGSRRSWRFRVPDGEEVCFEDGHFGRQSYVAGKDFGDFVVWRQDGIPSYQLATVVDDHGMQITEVVRGADLLLSTARQLLLYRALELTPPKFFHCPLMTDENGRRLSKRSDGLSLRKLRERGMTPVQIRQQWGVV